MVEAFSARWGLSRASGEPEPWSVEATPVRSWADMVNPAGLAQTFTTTVAPKTTDVRSLPPTGSAYVDNMNSIMAHAGGWSGSKFPGGYRDPAGWGRVRFPDLVTLRARSAELFQSNLYARGIIRRLVTNEIHTGLSPEATPIESVIGVPEGSMLDWSENAEVRYHLWGNASPSVCDHSGLLSIGEIQQLVRRESIVNGDCLVVVRSDKDTRRPTIQIIPGSEVLTPFSHRTSSGTRIMDGVEIDAAGRHIAYHVRKTDSLGIAQSTERFVREKDGRMHAWLVYGSDRRAGTVRGEPMLGIILQSLSEIDRYRDSVQRKAVINSMIAMFIQKDLPTVGSDALSAAAIGSGTMGPNSADTSKVAQREYSISEATPGIAIEGLAPGEKVQGFKPDGVDLNFSLFEESIVRLMAWGLEVPPEVLMLGFSSNYSAAQGATNEFQIYLQKARKNFSEQFLQPIYADWLISEALIGTVKAVPLRQAVGDRSKFDVVAAWTSVDWAGAVKPTADPVKTAKAAEILLNLGLTTHSRLAKQLGTGKWSQIIKVLQAENTEIAKARAILEPAPEPAEDADRSEPEDENNDVDDS